MTALLLTNTIAAQQVAQAQKTGAAPNLSAATLSAPGQSQAETLGTAAGPQAVAPAQSGRDARASGQSSCYSGSGSGAGGAAAEQPVWTRRRPDATPESVVAARTQTTASDRLEEMARDAALAVIAARREAALLAGASPSAEVIDRAQQSRDMANEMPDPLPTAPVLQKN
ncbi:hypothetical protein [Sulfitobacter sp. PS-8MA]|uniref:hypothetical protein n=1 Tax=Sulfitobacter sp. PS-8MA TaxID=3237707 RepID=UPI0034C61D33